MKTSSAYILAPSKTYASRGVLEKIRQRLRKEGIKLSFDWMNVKDDHPLDYVDHAKAIQALKTSDLVFAEVSEPSTGVGQQISFAIANKVPILCLYQKSSKELISPFLKNTKSPYLFIKEYTGQNIEQILTSFIKTAPGKNYQKFNFISTVEINEFLEKKSRELNLSKSDLLRNILQDWMDKETRD